MKIQCSCGAKYAFDVTPEQAQQPVRFVCPACGLDSSDFVNQLVRQELGLDTSTVAKAAPVVAPVIELAPPPAPASTLPPVGAERPPASPAPPAPSPPIQVRLHRSVEKAPEVMPVSSEPGLCPKHPGQRTVETCCVCGKPICPKCMALFGYLCSAACKGKADLQGIEVPVYAGQKALVERRRWRRVGLVAAAASVVLAAFLGVWIWYAWFGSVPKAAFSVRFTDPAYSGASRLCGSDQIVFLHGGTLARHDLKAKKEIWSCELVDKSQIAQRVEKELKARSEQKAKAESINPDLEIKIPSAEKLTRLVDRATKAALDLRVSGQNIWVASPGKLVRYDWDTGKPAQEISLANRFGGFIPRGDELLMVDERPEKQVITHINLATGQTRDEEIARTVSAATNLVAKTGSAARRPNGKEMAGLPKTPGKDAGKPLDPEKVSEQASHLSLPEKLALPATLSANRTQERALAEMNDGLRASPPGLVVAENFSLIPTRDGCVQFASQLVEERIVTRAAMKAPPKKSALDGPVNAAASVEVANEILNEMQRDRGGATVTEDESRYRVTIRRSDVKDCADWTGEVVGPPGLFPLKTVNVLASNKKIQVFDQQNKKLWEGTLNFNVAGGGGSDDESSPYGAGPCVERGDSLYVFDQGVLSAFDLRTGNVRWRVPSVGVSGLFFDDQEMLYANTTTAGPEKLKYSRQIDISSKVGSVVLKIEPRTGKTLWASDVAGPVAYVSGQFIYTLQSYQPFDEDEDNPYKQETGFETPPYVRIKRINPKNGKEMWEHFEQRAPLDVRFDKNSIQLVFKKEVAVLKYLAF